MASPIVITFFVEDLPPKKDGAKSMWNKKRELPRLKALRIAATEAMQDRPLFEERVELTITLYAKRIDGDLDNFISGICDGLQAAATLVDESQWLDVPEEAHPRHPIVFHNDKLVESIHATRTVPPDGRQRYEVRLVGN